MKIIKVFYDVEPTGLVKPFFVLEDGEILTEQELCSRRREKNLCTECPKACYLY